MDLDEASKIMRRVMESVLRTYIGKRDVVETIVAAFFAEGHVLIEGVPGTGKTLLAKLVARSIGGKFSRVQGHPDILPSDILGFHVYSLDGRARLIKGPVFSNILFFDELNRAPLRSQSALLEAMQERQVTIDGVIYLLPRPFMVIASQVPSGLTVGATPLMEPLLDRFMARVYSIYNSAEEEYHILRVADRADELSDVEPVASAESVLKAINVIKERVVVGERVAKYIVDLVTYIRSHEAVEYGPSHRGSIHLYRIARSYAAMQGRNYVTPDDVKRFAVEVLAHKTRIKREKALEGITGESVVKEALRAVKVPKE